MSNETPVKPERDNIHHATGAGCARTDPTRLITSALNHVEDTSADVRTLADPLAEALDRDRGSTNILGWYWGRIEDADKMQWKSKYDKPLIMSEFGGGAPFGRHGDADERWTEEYQVSLLSASVADGAEVPNLVGLTPWVLMDFRFPGANVAGCAGLPQSQGVAFGPRAAQAGVLRFAEVLQKDWQRKGK